MEGQTAESRFDTMSYAARQAYAKALAASFDGRLPLLSPGLMASYCGLDYKPETMLWAMTEWLVTRLARLVVEGGEDFLDLDHIHIEVTQ